MNRRRFCKIGALAMGALGLGVFDARSSALPFVNELRPMRSFRLTVIRRECYEDIQSLYLDDPESGPCEVFSPGVVMEFANGCECPSDFCHRAWSVIIGSVNMAVQSCVAMRENVLVVACPDGARPVIFKVDLL